MIPTLLEFVREDKQFKTLLTLNCGGSAKPANFNEIEGKSHKYKSFFELQSDVKWMVHNWAVAFPKKRKLQELMANLTPFIKDAVHSVKTCRDCYADAYAHPENSFELPCDPPHVIVWAKYSEYYYWPSKVMTTTDQIVQVRFFGVHCTGTEEKLCIFFKKY